MSLRVRFSVLCVVILAMPAFAAPPSLLNLSGTYQTNVESPNERVVVEQLKDRQGNVRVRATYESPHTCKGKANGAIITQLFEVPLDANFISHRQLGGKMTVCEDIEKLITDCHLPKTFNVSFLIRAEPVKGFGSTDFDMISGKYQDDKVVPKVTRDGHWTNCSVTEGGGDTKEFHLIPTKPLNQKR